MHFDVMEMTSPLGPLSIISQNEMVHALGFCPWSEQRGQQLSLLFSRELKSSSFQFHHAVHPNASHQKIEAYFEGDLSALESIPIALYDTDFQKRTLSQVRQILPGQTRSYAQIAHEINQPHAIRAVGHANALNAIALIIPCHRVIGSDGQMRGYAYGIEKKQWLLNHERTNRR